MSRSSRRPSRARAGVALLGALSVACGSLTDPPLPETAERFAPPPAYARWWALTEACSGISRPLGDVTFYRVPHVSRVDAGVHGEVAGYWSAASNRIVLAGDVVDDGRTVRHEMLHALLDAGGHPPAHFQDRCAGVVSCADVGCRDQGAPSRPAAADAPTLPLAALDVAVDVLANPVARTGGDGTLTLVVRATNPRPVPVWVTLDASPDLLAPWVRGFGFRIVPAGAPLPVVDLARADSAGMITVDSVRRVAFGAGQTRRWAIDLPASLYRAGEYRAVGIFNTRQAWAPLTVAP